MNEWELTDKEIMFVRNTFKWVQRVVPHKLEKAIAKAAQRKLLWWIQKERLISDEAWLEISPDQRQALRKSLE